MMTSRPASPAATPVQPAPVSLRRAGYIELDDDPWAAMQVLAGEHKGDRDYAMICLFQAIMLEFSC